MRTGTRRRPALLLTCAALSGAVLTGCGTASFSSAAEPASSADIVPVASDSPVAPADLSAGLLPAEAFGPGATVTPLTPESAGELPTGDLRSALEGVTVTPESCTTVLTQLAGAVDPGGIDGGAAQLATLGSTRTVQGIASGPAVAGALDTVAQAAAACPTATVSAPQLGTATVTVTPLAPLDLGDGAAAYSIGVIASGTGGMTFSVQALAGLVQDGDRVVGLLSADLFAPADEPAFLALLEQAHQQQADALD